MFSRGFHVLKVSVDSLQYSIGLHSYLYTYTDTYPSHHHPSQTSTADTHTEPDFENISLKTRTSCLCHTAFFVSSEENHRLLFCTEYYYMAVSFRRFFHICIFHICIHVCVYSCLALFQQLKTLLDLGEAFASAIHMCKIVLKKIR